MGPWIETPIGYEDAKMRRITYPLRLRGRMSVLSTLSRFQNCL
jgi:hypothetical protein